MTFIFHTVCILFVINSCFSCWTGSSSDKALGYGLDGPGKILGVGEVEIFFTSSCSDWSWGPLSLQKMSTVGLPRGKGGRA